MVQAIHTAVPGRVRYKVEGLYHSEALKKFIELQLGQQRGIKSVSANPLTGNVLVSFNSHNTPPSLVRRLEKIVTEYRRQSLDSVEVDLGSRRIRKRLSTAQSHKLSAQTADTQLAQSPTQPQFPQRVSLKDQPVKSWHLMSAQEVLASFKTNQAKGLSPQTVQRHLRSYGPNVLPEAEARSDLEILWEQINSLPVGLLTAAAGFSLLTGGLVDAIAIMGVVSINAAIGYVTESQSEKTIHSLKNLVRPSALVIRNGRPIEVSAEEVVIGDILILKPGSYVPADSRLIEAHHLSVDESALTGESLPVSKIVDPLTISDLPLADRVNMVYMGTLVTGGQGLAVVTATGRFTEIGTIQMLADGAQSPQTPMERQLDQMGSQLVYLSSAVCGVVFGIGVLRGYGWLEMFLSSISLAVAAVPEGLPTVAVTTLALGIRNMRRHKVLIRHLDAVEALGSMETICLDKTGTLTLNQMKVTAAYTGMQRVQIADESFRVGEHTVEPLSHGELVKMAQVCVLCSESEIEQQADNYMFKGSPTENALIYMAINAGVDVTALRKQLPMLRVDLRSENRNFMRTLHRVTPPYQNGTSETTPAPLFVGVKGSPAEVLEQCTWQLKDGQRLPLTDEDRGAIETENERMAGEALRVLGVAYTEHANSHTPPASETDLTDLTWLGLVGMVDPIRDGVKAVVGGFHQAGINTIMITGDQSPTAYAIGRELDISNQDHLEILDSTHIANVDPAVLTALSEKVHVFSRVSPAHKLQIVQALQRAGKVVAMTGDGINDGPALKAADIGIAMGHTGTDVAREVADVVLEDDNLETMIVAVSQGRTIYRNIRKSVRFLLATNLSEIVVMSAAIAGGLGHPLNTLQLLWINLVSDIFPGLALAMEPPEPDILEQPPRDPEEPIIQTEDFKRLGFEAAMLSAGALGAYGYGLVRYGAGVQAGTLAFTSLTTGQLLNAITARSETESVFSAPDRPSNPYLNAAVFGSLGLQALTLAVPGLRSLLGLAPIGLLDGLVIGSSVAIPFVINEQTKQPADQQTDEEADI